MNEQDVDLHLLWPKSFGRQKKGEKEREKESERNSIPKGADTHATGGTVRNNSRTHVFTVLCFLCPATVLLLSMSQILNDRCVCAGCMKEGCL